MGLAKESPQFHVLAVDDSIIDRKLIEMLLKNSSYQVTTVDSGSKALEFLGFHEDEQNNPNQPSVYPNIDQEVEVNLIITDYCMPGMTGYDLLKKVKESSALRNIPVVIMSSENVPSRINRCLKEGAEEFFLKPVRLSDVNKLKPHMMKTKFKDHQNQEKEESEKPEIQQPPPPNNNKRKAMEEGLSPDRINRCLKEGAEEFFLKPVRLSDVNKLKPHMMKTKFKDHQNQEKEESEKPEIQQPPPPPPNNNKRKAMEEGLSPDRTRPRYSGITVVSN